MSVAKKKLMLLLLQKRKHVFIRWIWWKRLHQAK